MKVYPLIAKNIKKGMINSGINPVWCRQGHGSVKKGINVVVNVCDLKETIMFFKNLGIVDMLGHEIKMPKLSRTKGTFQFTTLYMSKEMYNELQE